MLGSLGFTELMFILVLALLIFGPKKLPEIGRTLGRGISEFRKASTELKRSFHTELALEENPVPPSYRPRRVEPEPVEDLPEPGEAPPQTEPRAAMVPPSVDPQ